MKKIFIVFVLCCFPIYILAQLNFQTMIKMSHNTASIGLGISHDRIPGSGILDLGIGRLYHNTAWNDFLFETKINYTFKKFAGSDFYATGGSGFCRISDPFISTWVVYPVLNLGYKKYTGTKKKHSFMIELGYMHGTKSYLQHYENDMIHISTIGQIRLSPIYYRIGYSYNFSL